MINSLKGTFFLSFLFFLYFLGGPVLIVIEEENENNKEISFSFLNIFISSIIPKELISLGCILIILYSIRFLEHLFGFLKIFLTSIICLIFDIFFRLLIFILFKIQINKTGPLSILVYLVLQYFIFFPTIKSKIFNINEKILLLICLFIIIIFSGITSLIPTFIGIIFYLIF